MKFSRRRNNCQQKFLDPEVLPEIKENIEKYCSLLSYGMLRILKQIFFLKQRYNIFRVSQQSIANRCRVTREYVNKVLKEFEQVGILKSWYHHKETSHYRISSYFTDAIIASLSYLWRAIPLSFLVSNVVPAAISQNSSQYIKRTYIIDNCYSTDTVESISLCGREQSQNRSINKNQIDLENSSNNSRNSFNKKGNNTMKADLKQLDFDYIKSIKPTLAGKIKLTVYPETVIREADEQLNRTVKTIENRWSYFTQICNVLCKKQGIEINWASMYRLSTQLGIAVEAPFYDPNFIPTVIPVTVSASKGNFNKGNAKGGNYTGSTPKSVSMKEAILHNRSITEMYNPTRAKNLPPVNTEFDPSLKGAQQRIQNRIDAELEELCAADPKRYEWRMNFARNLLIACGRDPETGDAMPDFDPIKAAEVLNNALK